MTPPDIFAWGDIKTPVYAQDSTDLGDGTGIPELLDST
jgi:hypothetical protein